MNLWQHLGRRNCSNSNVLVQPHSVSNWVQVSTWGNLGDTSWQHQRDTMCCPRVRAAALVAPVLALPLLMRYSRLACRGGWRDEELS